MVDALAAADPWGPFSLPAGEGGNSASGTGGSGGSSSATAIAKSVSGEAIATADATGGNGGNGVTDGLGGAAAARSSASGAAATSDATATGGVGDGIAARALALAAASGVSGAYSAAAHGDPGAGSLVQLLMGSASGSVDGKSSAYGGTKFAGAEQAYTNAYQALAVATALPIGADTAPVLSAHGKLAAAFGAAPTFAAIGEMGGRYDTGGIAAETVDDQINLTIDPTQVANAGDLVLGLYDGASFGAGIANLNFDVTVNGAALVNETFPSSSQAKTCFANDALDLGALASLGAGGPIALDISLSETTKSANSGFFGNFLLGASHG